MPFRFFFFSVFFCLRNRCYFYFCGTLLFYTGGEYLSFLHTKRMDSQDKGSAFVRIFHALTTVELSSLSFLNYSPVYRGLGLGKPSALVMIPYIGSPRDVGSLLMLRNACVWCRNESTLDQRGKLLSRQFEWCALHCACTRRDGLRSFRVD